MLQWLDNFQQYGTNSAYMLNGPYADVRTGAAEVSIVADPDPTASGNVIKLASGSDNTAPYNRKSYFRKVLTTPTPGPIGVMHRMWCSSLPASTSEQVQPLQITDESNDIQITITLSPIGTFRVYRGYSQQTLIGESSIAIVANAWQHVEYKVSIHDTTGSVEIRVEGDTVLNLTNVDTKATSSANAANVLSLNTIIGVSGTGPILYLKDFVIWDTTGSYNSDFIGSSFVYSMRPDSDISGTWSIFGGAGSAYASMNETSPDDDTKYIYSGWPAATAQVCTVSDLPADATSVKGLMAFVRSRKSDGGDGNLQVSLVSNGVTGSGSDRPITTAYTYWSDMFETDPDTTVQWTVAATNAVRIKLDRTL